MSLYYIDPLDSSYYPSTDLINSDSFRMVAQPMSSVRNEHAQSYPVYDPESPFNSHVVPVKSVGVDGRLKTRLMGIGTDGGFLTSPLTFGRNRINSNPTGSDLRFESPVVSVSNSLNGSVSSLIGGGDSYQGHMLGRGIELDGGNGLSDLQGSLDMVNYASLPADYSNQRAYYPPSGNAYSKRSRTVSEASTLSNRQYQDYNSNIGRPPPVMPRQHTRDVGAPPIHFVEHRFPQSPPLAPKPTVTAPNTPRRVRKVSEGGSAIKSLNKVRSCPSLVPGSAPRMEPLTPVSSQFPGNFPPGVPFNSPTDNAAIASLDPSIMPFSFADLYNYGLAADSIDNIDPRKSPHAFANDLLGTENGLSGATTFGDLSDHDFGLLYGLPTPHLAPSGFSSPSTTFNSEPSPPENLISPVLLNDSYVAIAPPPQIQSRQRCLPYNNRPLPPLPMEASGSLDSSFFGPVTGHRHVSTPDFVPNPTYSYPTNYAQETGHLHHLGPYAPSSWHTNQAQVNDFGRVPEQYLTQPSNFVALPPIPKSSTTPQRPPPIITRPPRTTSFSAQAGLFSAAGGLFEPLPALEAKARDDETIDLLFEGYGQIEREEPITTAPSTPKKRGRETDEEDDYQTDGDGDYKPAFGSPSALTDSARKRQRVVSAPASVGRRLRPGPRPKSASRSPQEACQSVFSLSPPPVPYRSVSSPYLSDHSGPFEDTFNTRNSILEAAGIPKPLAGDSLPRTVIQSLYNALPATKTGTKNAKRYICLIEGCDRTFPRKSAIESHIQTHLEDKPFVCPADDCDASFVRQHDLRRHERIHSGNKPFPCPCGKGFARGDALQRHRQRGICSGSTVPRRRA